MINPQLKTFDNWTFQWQPAQKEPGRLLILLHGWTGDENSMWLLARHISSNYSILAPRGIYSAPEGGYSWRQVGPQTWGFPSFNDLRPAAEAILKFIDAWAPSINIDALQFDLMGFSQGAALTYLMAVLYPDRVRKAAALSGFLPDGLDETIEEGRLAGKAVFVSHGRQDEVVPVERARSSVIWLKKARVDVTYCESDGGHKVSKNCLNAMEGFLGES